MIIDQERLAAIKLDENEPNELWPESIPDGMVSYVVRVYFNKIPPHPSVLYEPTNSLIVKLWRLTKHHFF
jgi:hypothetical protein